MVVATAAFVTSPARAAPDADGMVAAFAEWVKKYKVEDASFAVRHGGKIIGTYGYGARTPETPVNVASLSKAITGACIAKLVGQNRIKFDDTLGDVLKTAFATYGDPVDPRAKSITVAQLLMHMSGLRYDWALTRKWPVEAHEIALDRQAMAALEHPLFAKPGTRFWYNNTNFAILGAIIESTTGKAYASFCSNAILEPSGVDAGLDPEAPAMSSWAGWFISAVEYVKFLDIFDHAGKKLGVPVSEWPGADLGYPTHSLGVVLSRDGKSYELFHQGGWWGTRGGEQTSWASYFEKWADGTAYAATFAPHPPDKAYGELSKALSKFKATASKVSASAAPVASGGSTAEGER